MITLERTHNEGEGRREGGSRAHTHGSTTSSIAVGERPHAVYSTAQTLRSNSSSDRGSNCYLGTRVLLCEVWVCGVPDGDRHPGGGLLKLDEVRIPLLEQAHHDRIVLLAEGLHRRLVRELYGAGTGLLLEPLDDTVRVTAASVLGGLAGRKGRHGERYDGISNSASSGGCSFVTLPLVKSLRVGKPWTAYFSARDFSWVASTCEVD